MASWDYGGWELPWSTVCKLDIQESQWCSYKRSLKAWEPGQPMVLVWLKKTDVPAQNRQRECADILTPSFCSSQASEGLDEAHPHRGRQVTLLSLPIQCESHPETPSQTHPK